MRGDIVPEAIARANTATSPATISLTAPPSTLSDPEASSAGSAAHRRPSGASMTRLLSTGRLELASFEYSQYWDRAFLYPRGNGTKVLTSVRERQASAVRTLGRFQAYLYERGYLTYLLHSSRR